MVAGDALACGDKLVIVGRGLRAKRKAVSKASILVYARPGGSVPTALGEGGLQKNLERAGHRVSRVDSEQELKEALGAGGHDLVLADFEAASRVEAQAKSSAAHPTVLPTLYNPSPSELKAAETAFHCVLKAPAKEKDYLAVVDEAMAARAKEAKAGKK
jgi:DNA-binding NtrC family response regulator